MSKRIRGRRRLGLIAGTIGGTAALGLAGAAQGAMISNYTFDGGSRASVDTDALSTASDITNGPGLNTSSNSTTEGDPAPSLELNRDGTGTDDGLASDRYLTFTVDTPAGGAIDFDSISYGLSAFAPSGGGFGDNTFARWSVDGYASNILDIETSTSDSARDAAGFEVGTGDLSGSALQSGPVTFRVYFDGLNGSGSKGFRIDNVQVNGSTVVPEPASLALMGLGGLAALGRRRRRNA